MPKTTRTASVLETQIRQWQKRREDVETKCQKELREIDGIIANLKSTVAALNGESGQMTIAEALPASSSQPAAPAADPERGKQQQSHPASANPRMRQN
jgi:hypothetical protein